MAPGVCLIVAVTPSFLGAATMLAVVGHWTVVPEPGPALNASLMALRCLVNTKVVPLLSERRTTVILVSGSVTPGIGRGDARVIPAA